MVGGQPLHTFADYLETASLKVVSNVSDGKEGVRIVLGDTRFLLNSFKEILELAGEAGDEGTAALMSEWIGAAEKRIWMLESSLG
jgi:starvation-inducible DNA-binding protein